MFDDRFRQDLNRGFSDAFGRGVDLALTPVAFGLIGWFVDRLLGTSPIFTIVIASVGLVGTVVKMKLGYDKDMDAATTVVAGRPRDVKPTIRDAKASRDAA